MIKNCIYSAVFLIFLISCTHTQPKKADSLRNPSSNSCGENDLYVLELSNLTLVEKGSVRLNFGIAINGQSETSTTIPTAKWDTPGNRHLKYLEFSGITNLVNKTATFPPQVCLYANGINDFIVVINVSYWPNQIYSMEYDTMAFAVREAELGQMFTIRSFKGKLNATFSLRKK